jgi:hypothetical protein
MTFIAPSPSTQVGSASWLPSLPVWDEGQKKTQGRRYRVLCRSAWPMCASPKPLGGVLGAGVPFACDVQQVPGTSDQPVGALPQLATGADKVAERLVVLHSPR